MPIVVPETSQQRLTLSMLFSTLGWEPRLGFPALSGMPGQFLLKDIVYLGASIWCLGESLKTIEA
jgi:uncharacterized membrane protein YkgB